MTPFIETLYRLLEGVGLGDNEPQVPKSRYIALLPVATANLQQECLYSLLRALSADSSLALDLEAELELQNGRIAAETLEKFPRKFTVAEY